MSYNLQSLHSLYIIKIKTKKELQNKVDNLNKKELNVQEQNELDQALIKLQTQYKNVLSSIEEYTLQNLNLISLIYEENFNCTNEIYNDYVKKYFNDDVNTLKEKNEIKTQFSNCPDCGINNWVENTKSDDYICLNCGFAKSANRVVVTYEKGLELKSRGKKNGYSKSKSLQEFLDYLQLKKAIGLSKDEEKKITDKLIHIKKERITVNLIQSAMQKLKLNKQYNDKYYMYHMITGKKISLSNETEKKIQFFFHYEQKAFELLKGSHHRINIFLYKYSVKKIIELMLFNMSNPEYKPVTEATIDMSYPNISDLSNVNENELYDMVKIIPVPIIMSFENLAKYDKFWCRVCLVLGWKFISSF